MRAPIKIYEYDHVVCEYHFVGAQPELNPQALRWTLGYKMRLRSRESNLPGTRDTVIKQAVPSGGDSGLALCRVEACDLPKRGRLGCAIFARGGLRSRIPRTENH